ncbi:MAG: ABC transporter permease [Promethearchaeota archaeon]
MTSIKLVFKYALKDLNRKRVRTLMGVIGVTISVGLLALVLFISDSISVSFMEYVTSDAGNQDIVISVRHYNGEPSNRSSYFSYQDIIDKVESATDEIDKYIPRMEVDGKVNISKGVDTTELTNLQETALISGINFEKEKEDNYGAFIVPDSNDYMDFDELKVNECAIYYGFNNIIKYSEGDTIEITMSLTHGDKYIKKTVNLTIAKIFDYSLKWPGSYRHVNLITVDIETLYYIFGYDEFNGKCSKLILTFKDPEKIYDARDVDGTKARVKAIAEDIQFELGINEWTIELPKLEEIGLSEFLSMGITVIFVFVSIIAMLIAGVLINGILKTSVEERIREFGIFRTLGAHKSYNLWVVLVQGFLLCNFGTIAGILLAFFGSQYIIIPFANEYILGDFLGPRQSVQFSWTIWSFIIAYAMGIGVGLLVSISPAIKVMKLQLIESIHPYRHEDTLYHLQKKASINYKLIIVGIILAVNGGNIYFIIPRLLISMNITLMAGTFIAVLLIFLIGLTLAGLGLMPVVLRLVIEFFRPVAKRIIHVIRIFVFRYQRRNSSTIIIFALSFSFVIFTSTILDTQTKQVAVLIRVRFGSDLVMESIGWEEINEFGGEFGGGGGFFTDSIGGTATINDAYSNSNGVQIQSDQYNINPDRIMTTDFKNDLLAIDGVERVSVVLASPEQLTQIYSEGNKKFSAELADYAGLSTNSISLIGIDSEYPATVDTDYIVFTRGDMDKAFNKLFTENSSKYNCIVSEGIAVEMNLELNDRVRITIQRGDELKNYEFHVVGMASSIPGFSFEFGSSRFSANNGGVLISQEVYQEIMDLPEPTWVNKIFIKLQESKKSEARSIEKQIDDLYKNDYDYDLYNLERMVEREESSFAVINVFFTIILMATVLICLFGLLSSSYSTILERRKEIGIVRTLGLKGKEIDRMFIIEALIIMLSSGTIGTIVGWLTGWLLASNLNLFTDMPYSPQFPWFNFTLVYGVSIIFTIFGMRLLLRKSRKQKIVDIYRETL